MKKRLGVRSLNITTGILNINTMYSLIGIRWKLNYLSRILVSEKKVRDKEGASYYQVHLETARGLRENHTSLSFYQRLLLVLWWVIHLYRHPEVREDSRITVTRRY